MITTVLAALAQSSTFPMPTGVPGVAYRNGCTSGCAGLWLCGGVWAPRSGAGRDRGL